MIYSRIQRNGAWLLLINAVLHTLSIICIYVFFDLMYKSIDCTQRQWAAPDAKLIGSPLGLFSINAFVYSSPTLIHN